MKIKSIHAIFILFTFSIVACATSATKTPKFQPGATTTVLFTFNNVKDSIPFQLYNLPIISTSKYNKSTFIHPQKSTAQLLLPCDHPSPISVFINQDGINIYTLPNDTLEITIQLSDAGKIENVHFQGKTRVFCDYFKQKQQQLGYQDLRVPLNQASTSPQEILNQTDSLMQLELNFLETYQQNHPLPKWFIDTEECQIIYLCNSFKQARETIIKKHMNQEFTPPSDYYRSFDTLVINNPQGQFSHWYFEFLKTHLVYRRINANKLAMQAWIDTSTHNALATSALELTGSIQDIFNFSILNHYLNSTKNLSLFDQYFSTYKKDFSNNYFFEILETKRDALNDSILSQRNDGYIYKTKNQLSTNDSLPNFYLPDTDNNFFSSKNFDKEIIYISFWATWCKPCLASVPSKNDLINRFSSNDKITFLNICISSKKEDWQKLITEHQIKGVNLFANENWSKMLKQKYQVNQLPAYFLIQNGKIKKPFCDSPEYITDDIQFLLTTNSE
ncbi:TlpA family protein disulfide reductase [Sunxiuqinia elliptica]